MRKYSGLHRRQLFHWIGGHIEERPATGRVLKNGNHMNYLKRLRVALGKGSVSGSSRRTGMPVPDHIN